MIASSGGRWLRPTAIDSVWPFCTGTRVVVALTKFYDRVKAAQPQTGVELVIATSIKDFLPPVLAVLFTLLKEKNEGHRVTLAAGDLRLSDLLSRHKGQQPSRARVTADDDAVILASGGTTGTPKGVVGQHKAYVYTGLQLYTWNKAVFDPVKDVILVPLPMFHVYANVGGFGLGVVTGSPLAMVPNPRDLPDVLKTIKATRPAFMLSVPTLFQAMLNNPDVRAGKVDFSSIKISFSGAMALMKATKEQFEQLTGGRIIEGYSLTEGMMGCLVNPLKGKRLTNIRAAGKDENVVLVPPIRYTLEQAMEFIVDDELVEVTPTAIRLRKRFLKEHERKRSGKASEEADE